LITNDMAPLLVAALDPGAWIGWWRCGLAVTRFMARREEHQVVEAANGAPRCVGGHVVRNRGMLREGRTYGFGASGGAATGSVLHVPGIITT
jgi:hypothetical protein